MIDIKKRILSLMNQRKMTKYELAKRAKISNSTITSIFNSNKIALRIDTLETICDALEITISDFFIENEEQLVTKMNVIKYEKLSNKSRKIVDTLIDLLE